MKVISTLRTENKMVEELIKNWSALDQEAKIEQQNINDSLIEKPVKISDELFISNDIFYPYPCD